MSPMIVKRICHQTLEDDRTGRPMGPFHWDNPKLGYSPRSLDAWNMPTYERDDELRATVIRGEIQKVRGENRPPNPMWVFGYANSHQLSYFTSSDLEKIRTAGHVVRMFMVPPGVFGFSEHQVVFDITKSRHIATIQLGDKDETFGKE